MSLLTGRQGVLACAGCIAIALAGSGCVASRSHRPVAASFGTFSIVGSAARQQPPGKPRHVSLSRMLGQMMISRLAGSAPSASLLQRIREGQAGGVILFSENVIGGASATRTLIGRLQQAARKGGNPPLLVMADQEGGEVRRLSWAPPVLAASQMTSAALAEAEGEATGRALRFVGVNLDLAPVADVTRVRGSFLGSRAFGANPFIVAERACSFASGLAKEGVAFTLKHFPGLGRAEGNTDLGPVIVRASAQQIRADYEPYVYCGANPMGVAMVSSATYPRLSSGRTPAVLAPQTYSEELPIAIEHKPLTISDDLQAGALAKQPAVAQRAVRAGLDMLLFATTEAGSANAYRNVLASLRKGGLARSRAEAAYKAIIAFKQQIAAKGTRDPKRMQRA